MAAGEGAKATDRPKALPSVGSWSQMGAGDTRSWRTAQAELGAAGDSAEGLNRGHAPSGGGGGHSHVKTELLLPQALYLRSGLKPQPGKMPSSGKVGK